MLSLVVAMALFESTVMEMLLVEAQQQLSTDALVPDALLCQQCAEPTAPSSMSGACAALAADEKEASVLGLQLHPLRSLDELAAVLEAQLVFPEGTPRRARRMLEELRLRGVNLSTEFELTQLIERLEASDGWAAALDQLRVPSERRIVLVPPVTRCVVPGCQGGRLVRGGRARRGGGGARRRARHRARRRVHRARRARCQARARPVGGGDAGRAARPGAHGRLPTRRRGAARVRQDHRLLQPQGGAAQEEGRRPEHARAQGEHRRHPQRCLYF